ncbi:MAG: hypothetical protein ACJ8DI_05970 [Ktedonobacteraceae bacterium]
MDPEPSPFRSEDLTLFGKEGIEQRGCGGSTTISPCAVMSPVSMY